MEGIEQNKIQSMFSHACSLVVLYAMPFTYILPLYFHNLPYLFSCLTSYSPGWTGVTREMPISPQEPAELSPAEQYFKAPSIPTPPRHYCKWMFMAGLYILFLSIDTGLCPETKPFIQSSADPPFPGWSSESLPLFTFTIHHFFIH